MSATAAVDARIASLFLLLALLFCDAAGFFNFLSAFRNYSLRFVTSDDDNRTGVTFSFDGVLFPTSTREMITGSELWKFFTDRVANNDLTVRFELIFFQWVRDYKFFILEYISRFGIFTIFFLAKRNLLRNHDQLWNRVIFFYGKSITTWHWLH